MPKYVYDLSEGEADMVGLLGRHAAALADLLRLDVPVPDGFTVTTAACVEAGRRSSRWPPGLWDEVLERLAALEDRVGRRLGAAERPLLLAVRASTPCSMPRTMPTVLNLGFGPATVEALAAEWGDERFAWDTYRRFLRRYGTTVAGVPVDVFGPAGNGASGRDGRPPATADELRALAGEYRLLAREHADEVPTDPREQLRLAIDACFRAWQNPRVRVYRRTHGIPDDVGAAVTVMSMAFGNLGDRSASGVCCTRDPSTGRRELTGEFLLDAQGDDLGGHRERRPLAELADLLPGAHAELRDVAGRVEADRRDLQRIEFVVERGRLVLLGARSGRRSARGAVRIARDLVEEGVLRGDEAVLRVDPSALDELMHATIAPGVERRPLARGLGASAGAATGEIALDAAIALRRAGLGEPVILVRGATTPDDTAAVGAARGVLTAHGGLTSHAALVARGLGTPCVTGCAALDVDLGGRVARLGGRLLPEGAAITIDGATGEVFDGALPLVAPALDEDLRAVGEWSDGVRRLGVRANADTAEEARRARELGAEGIGLLRTERLLVAAGHLPLLRDAILAADDGRRGDALAALLPVHQAAVERVLEVMAGLPVTIRLLDPPLHEFLPSLVDASLDVERLRAGGSRRALAEGERVLARVRSLTEVNPMLGTRGCRLGLLVPELYEMQVRAILRAARAVRTAGGDPVVEIMVPFVAYGEELRRVREMVAGVAEEELAPGGGSDLPIGAALETPRAALRADEIARHADFLSFGTNDLTQTALGISRDDAEGGFLTAYVQEGVVPGNPFATLDLDGVGELVRVGVERARGEKPGLRLGVCGEHAGDARSVAFFHDVGVDELSCAPLRLPVARLAAARAAVGQRVGAG